MIYNNMDVINAFPDNKIVYCRCPTCGAIRKKINQKFSGEKKSIYVYFAPVPNTLAKDTTNTTKEAAPSTAGM